MLSDVGRADVRRRARRRIATRPTRRSATSSVVRFANGKWSPPATVACRQLGDQRLPGERTGRHRHRQCRGGRLVHGRGRHAANVKVAFSQRRRADVRRADSRRFDTDARPARHGHALGRSRARVVDRARRRRRRAGRPRSRARRPHQLRRSAIAPSSADRSSGFARLALGRSPCSVAAWTGRAPGSAPHVACSVGRAGGPMRRAQALPCARLRHPADSRCLLFVVPSAVSYYTDWLWFQELGYEGIFLRTLNAQVVVFAATFAVVFLFLFSTSARARHASTVRTSCSARASTAGRSRSRPAASGRPGAAGRRSSSRCALGVRRREQLADVAELLQRACRSASAIRCSAATSAFYVFRLPRAGRSSGSRRWSVACSRSSAAASTTCCPGSFVIEPRHGAGVLAAHPADPVRAAAPRLLAALVCSA